ncbi:hypothetical protein [Micromonospora marina]|uniref:hypothetical protein n=1 Tax=Micromonospora marina TaxID=307120 RepID=UPI00345644C4
MTHPAPHPGTPTPPAGPSRHHATPLTAEERDRRYRAQTGRTELTPRQRKRRLKKANALRG